MPIGAEDGPDNYLLGKGVGRGEVSVALTINGRIGTSTDGIHFPVSVVVVHHMEVAVPTPEKRQYKIQAKQHVRHSFKSVAKKKQRVPGHPLNEAFAEMVECDGHLHRLVPYVGIAVTQ